jgi:hypothetical protein
MGKEVSQGYMAEQVCPYFVIRAAYDQITRLPDSPDRLLPGGAEFQVRMHMDAPVLSAGAECRQAVKDF